MSIDPEQLLARIRLGEDSTLELQEVRIERGRVRTPHRDGLADELAAFANAKGGLCVLGEPESKSAARPDCGVVRCSHLAYPSDMSRRCAPAALHSGRSRRFILRLGVEDGSRRITGIDPAHLDAVERHVQAACHDLVDPPLLPHILRLWLPGPDASSGHAVLLVEVPRSLFVHRSPGGYLVRSGSTRRELRSEQLARLFQVRSQTGIVRFDEEIVATAGIDTLDPALWRRFAPPRSRDPRAVMLHKLGLARRDSSGEWRATVSGVLMCSREPQRFLPNAWIQAVAYRGATTVPEVDLPLYQLDARDIHGPLDAQVIEACRFVVRNMKVRASKRMGRRDLPQYDMTAVFEAMVNAVAHRDYALHGARIRLRLLADRLELYSPGGLPNTLEPASLPYRQFARNETITSLLARCRIPEDADWLGTQRATYMDRRGEGVPLILERSRRLSGKEPEFRVIDDSELLLTIPAAEVPE